MIGKPANLAERTEWHRVVFIRARLVRLPVSTSNRAAHGGPVSLKLAQQASYPSRFVNLGIPHRFVKPVKVRVKPQTPAASRYTLG